MDDSTRIPEARSAPAPSTPYLTDAELLGDWVPQIVLDDYAIIPQYENRVRSRGVPYGMKRSTSHTLKS